MWGLGIKNKGFHTLLIGKNIWKVSYWFRCSIKINVKNSIFVVKWSCFTTGSCIHWTENSLAWEADIKISVGECSHTQKKIQLMPSSRQWLHMQ